MASLHFELVSPEKLLFSGEVEQVDVPGAEGDFGVLANHAPMVATLRPGILTVHGADGDRKIVVLGGFAEVSAQGLIVLADLAESGNSAIFTQRQSMNSGLCPPPGLRMLISLSLPVKRSANHFCFCPRYLPPHASPTMLRGIS